MKPTYQLTNIGRKKWTGIVVAQSLHQEHVEAALIRAVTPHLKSRDIDFNGDIEKGFILAGFHRVGQYKLLKESSK